MAFPFNQLFNFGGQNPARNAPPTPIMLELARQNAEAQNKIDPKHSEPAYSPWQLAGTVAKGLQGWQGQDTVGQAQARAAQAQASDYAQPQQGAVNFSAAPQTAVSANGAPTDISADVDPSSFNTGNPAPKNRGPINMHRLAYTTGMIESGGGSNESTSGQDNEGLYQFGPEERAKYGITDSKDHGQQRRALEFETVDAAKALKAAGLPVTEPNIYLLHQQGVAGGIALLQNPDAPATQVLQQFYKNPYLAWTAIAHNPYDKGLWGNGDMTAGQFTNGWEAHYDRIAANHGGAPSKDNTMAMAQMTDASPMMGLGARSLVQNASFTPPTKEGIGSAPQQATPAAQPQGPQMAQNTNNIPPVLSTVPSKPFTAGELMSLDALPDEMRKQFIEGRMRENQPQITHTPQGDAIWNNRNGGGAQWISKPEVGHVGIGKFNMTGPVTNVKPGGAYNNPMMTQGFESKTGEDLPTLGGRLSGEVDAAEQNVKDLQANLQGSRDHIGNLAQTLQFLKLQRMALEDPTYVGGAAGSEVGTLQNLLSYIPGYQGTGAAKEIVDKLNAKNILGAISQFSHDAKVGRILMPEVNAVLQTQGSEGNTKAGRIAINEIEQRQVKRALGMAQRTIDYVDKGETSVPNQLDVRFNKVRSDWLNSTENMAFKPGELEDFRKTLGLDEQREIEPLGSDSNSKKKKGHWNPNNPNEWIR